MISAKNIKTGRAKISSLGVELLLRFFSWVKGSDKFLLLEFRINFVARSYSP
jgi:hypothetical protein